MKVQVKEGVCMHILENSATLFWQNFMSTWHEFNIYSCICFLDHMVVGLTSTHNEMYNYTALWYKD